MALRGGGRGWLVRYGTRQAAQDGASILFFDKASRRRLTVNIRDDVHQALKIRAVQERTIVGDLIGAWVDGWKP